METGGATKHHNIGVYVKNIGHAHVLESERFPHWRREECTKEEVFVGAGWGIKGRGGGSVGRNIRLL